MSSALVCEFEVEGDPVAQGSMIARKFGDRAVVVASNDNALKKWRKAIAVAAATAHFGDPIEGAVLLEATFRLERGKTVKRELPSVRPDLDKLLRALCDGITQSGVWTDDALVTTFYASKTYAERTGVTVRIHQMEESSK